METTETTTTAATETTTPVLLDAACNVAAFASTDPKRYVINGVHVTREYAEATDGKMLIRVPLPKTDPAEFPPTTAPSEFAPGQILLVKPLLEALKSAKDAGRSCPLPICAMVRLSSSPAVGEKPAKLHLTTSDIDNERTIVVKPIEGSYPNVNQAIPTAEPKFSITLSADLLAEIAKYAIAHGQSDKHDNHGIRFDFLDSTDPVRFSINLPDGRKTTGVLMPMRME